MTQASLPFIVKKKENFIVLEVTQYSEKEWNEDMILQTILHDRTLDKNKIKKKIVIRIHLQYQWNPTKISKALHTIQRIINNNNNNNSSTISNHNSHDHPHQHHLCLVLHQLHVRSDVESFQTHVDLMNAISSGMFQEIRILGMPRQSTSSITMKETLAHALGNALQNHHLKQLYLQNVTIMTNNTTITNSQCTTIISSQDIVLEGLQNSRSIIEIQFHDVICDYKELYKAMKNHFSLERIVTVGSMVVDVVVNPKDNVRKEENDRDLLYHHCDLNTCGQAFLKHQRGDDPNNNDDASTTTTNSSSSTLLEVPLTLWPLILERMKPRLQLRKHCFHYATTTMPDLQTREARVIYEFLQKYLAHQLACHFGVKQHCQTLAVELEQRSVQEKVDDGVGKT